MFISYWLSPKHTVFVPNINDLSSSCSIKFEQNVNKLFYIEQYYNQAVKFSLSTPSLPYYNKIFGVGHVKISGSKLPRSNTSAFQFHSKHRYKLGTHPIYATMYLMYLYTFDPETFDILEISSGFFSPTTSYGIVFPVGLTYYNEKYIVSYGEGTVR